LAWKIISREDAEKYVTRGTFSSPFGRLLTSYSFLAQASESQPRRKFSLQCHPLDRTQRHLGPCDTESDQLTQIYLRSLPQIAGREELHQERPQCQVSESEDVYAGWPCSE
jgi:hypothetical protein